MLESIAKYASSEVTLNDKAIPSLVRLLESRTVPVLVGACRVLVNLTMDLNTTQAKALEANAVPALIHLLSFNNVQVQKSATFVLMNLTLYGPTRVPLVISNGVPNLVHLLSSNDVKIQTLAASVLENVTASCASEVAAASNAISSLVRLLTSRDSILLIAVCAVLNNLTLNIDHTQAKALDATDIISPMIQLLFFNDPRVQNPARSVLVNLAPYIPAKITTGVTPFLASDNIQIQESVKMVLECIPAHHDAEVAIRARATLFPARFLKRISQWSLRSNHRMPT